MIYTYIPEALLYKRKSIVKLAKLHPLNTLLYKRLINMDGWAGQYSRENKVHSCLNNAYYICTIMRLEYDATFQEYSYKQIARNGFIEGCNTLEECVTLSLVALLIEHSTPEWHNKLKEIANNLRKYAGSLYDEREGTILGCPDAKISNVIHLKGIPTYLSKDIDDSWVLPDDYFQPRTLDDKAFFDLRRQDPSFNWDKFYYHYDEDDIRDVLEMLGRTQKEKANLIRSMWKDIYYSRKKLDLPIKETWLFLKELANDYCPDYMEYTELHKIPETGIEFERRISELEAEVASLEQQLSNANCGAYSNQQTTDNATSKKQHDEIITETAFNAQTGNPCFTNRQMGILLTAVGRITEKDNPPGKTTLGEIVEKISGYKSTTASSNMRGALPKADINVVASAIESKFPNLAAKVRRL